MIHSSRASAAGARIWVQPAVALALLTTVPAAAQEPGTSEKPRLRLEYFDQQRAYPFDRIPAGALQRAYAQYRARWPTLDIARAPAAAALAQQAVGTSWTPLGPAPIANRDAGRISTIAVHPTSPSTIYIGAAQGGVWRTTDGGQNWVPLTDRECSLAMGSIALDPVALNIVYAGTGENHFSGDSYYGCGVLRSSNDGATWTRLGAAEFDTNTGGARIAKVIVDRATAGSLVSTTVFVASSFGVHRSTDSGSTWARVLTGIATDMVVHPSDPQTLYSAIGSTSAGTTNGVFKSTDGGATWTKLAGGFPTTDVGRIALAIAPSAPNVLYAAVQNAFENPRATGDGQLLGIWKSTDTGSTWIKLTASNASCGTQCWYDLVIAVRPTSADTVYFGGVQFYRSIDGGNSFQNLPLTGSHVDHHAIEFHPTDPSIMYTGNDGGIYRSTTSGTAWTSLNGNMQITQFYSGIGLHPSDENTVLGGTQDNGTLQFAGSEPWAHVLGGDGGFTAISFVNPDTAYAETQWTANSGFSGPRRRDGPTSFVHKVTGINIGDRALFIPPLVMDRTDPNVLYFGTYQLYRTSNQGELWASISSDLSRTGTGSISAIAPAESDPRTVYVGTNDGYLQVTIEGGATWSLRNNGLPQRYISDIAVDATNARVAIASVSGFGTGHVFRTTDGGVSWQDISGNLPDVPVNAVLHDPGLGNVIYIGTDLGIFRSTNGGGTWTPFNENFPNVAVFDLAFGRGTGTVVAATHGRGMFAFRPVIAASIAVSQDTVGFTAIGDTMRIRATATDSVGAPITQFQASWRSLNPLVAAVNPGGVVRSVGNGSTIVIAALGGRADSASITVRQALVAVTGLPDTASLVVGEGRKFEARAVDRNGVLVSDAIVTWSSADASVASVDGTGLVTARAAGSSTISATSGAVKDTSALRVGPAAVVVLEVAAAATPTTPSSAAGVRLALLRLQLRVTGFEPIRITRLGFEVRGVDAGARLVLILDRDGDGAIGPNDTEIGSAPALLRPGEPVQVTITPGTLEVPLGQTITVLAAIRMSGAAPNGTAFSASFLPAETRSIGTRSAVPDRITQPSAPVASAEVRATVLAAGQLFSLSENPVRSGAVIFNFPVRPSVAGIYTLAGKRVVDLTNRLSDESSVRWDLTNENGSVVSPGVYLLIFRIEGQQFRERLIVLRRASENEAGSPPTGPRT